MHVQAIMFVLYRLFTDFVTFHDLAAPLALPNVTDFS